MSQKRQTAIFEPLRDRQSNITTLMHDYPARHVIPLHFHDRDQLVYASQGVMTVLTAVGIWVVPTLRAVWIPASVPHSISMSGKVAMRTLYLKPRLARTLPRECCVVNVSPLLRELILHACGFHTLRKTVAQAAPPDRCDRRSTRSHPDGSSAASPSFRSPSGPRRCYAADRPQ